MVRIQPIFEKNGEWNFAYIPALPYTTACATEQHFEL